MIDLLRALDWKVSIGRKIGLLALLGFATLSMLMLGIATAEIADVSIALVQGAIWALWLVWLGVVFPRSRRRDVNGAYRHPYRRAFTREILWGVAVAFSQLLRPVLVGIADGREFSVVSSAALGLPFLLTGTALVFLGVAGLGVARTLFVYEYVPAEKFVKIVGIFRLLRHPLFLGGSLISLGLAFCTGAQIAVELAILNACIIPFYVQLEDRRCCTALGQPYLDYRRAVGGVIPRRSAISRSALAHHGSSSPTR